MDPASLDQLLERARRHDPDAFEQLVRAYGPRLFGLLLRLTGSRETAEDFVQETFLRVLRTIETYEHTGRFEAWLFRIAANLARDHGRQAGRRGPTASLDVPDESGASQVASLPGADPDAPGAALTVEEHERLQRSLATLPDLDREILVLRHFSDMSFREIAALLQVPLGTALARAHRALRRLRDEYEGHEREQRTDHDKRSRTRSRATR